MSPMIRSPLTIEHALLGFMRQRPMYGYEIYQQLSQAQGLGLVWHLKQSQLYALLTKLEQKGYISATLEPQDARPPRKVFELTQTGRGAFLQWIQNPVSQGRKLRLEFLAKLYFAQQEDPAMVSQLIERQRTASGAWLAEQRSRVDTINDTHPFDRLVHEFRLGQLEATLKWLDQCEQALLAPVSE